MLAPMLENVSYPLNESPPAPLGDWCDAILQAGKNRTSLQVCGMGSKDHLGGAANGASHTALLSTTDWTGIEAYEPSELVLTARAGTPLQDIEYALAQRSQYLPFEPPRGEAGRAGTLGGMVAAGLSGPSRAMRGAVRDHVLGVRMLNGRGQYLRFGGTVMKNVAGFDLSRLMAGSWGTLGALTEVSIKVLPQPVAAQTLQGDMPQAQAIEYLNRWAGQPLPLDASCWHQGRLTLRLCGAKAAVNSAMTHFLSAWPGAAAMAPTDADVFWTCLRDQRLDFFTPQADQCVWRLSLPATCPPVVLPDHATHDEDVLIEWQGSQRWWRTSASAVQVMSVAKAAGGHASLWRVADAAQAPMLAQAAQEMAWAQLSPVLQRWHRQVQQSFDPLGVFDTGRLWPRQSRHSR